MRPACADLFASSGSFPPCVSPPPPPSLPPAAPPAPPGMDPDPGAPGTFVSLSEQEQRYYAGLHGLCQADASGALSSGKVAELFKASQLPPESLHKVGVRLTDPLLSPRRSAGATEQRIHEMWRWCRFPASLCAPPLPKRVCGPAAL